MNHARKRITAWIAIFAVLLAALAPSLARAWAPSQKAMPWAEICTVAGVAAKYSSAPASGSGQHDGAGQQHCPLCLNHGGHLALPPAPFRFFVAAVTGTDIFPVPAASRLPHLIRLAAQPRAPPLNS